LHALGDRQLQRLSLTGKAMNRPRIQATRGPSSQRGVATLMVTLVILFILTLIILASSNVALFEQKTATNEYRQRLADQAAEYAMNLAGEFFKANVVNLASAQTDGWLATGTARWVTCASVVTMGANHPCMSEPNPTRRAQLYYYSVSGNTEVPFDSLVPTGAQLGNVGSVFSAADTTVSALLCRLDTTITASGVPAPACRVTPSVDSANRIAVTVAVRSQLTGENSFSEMKSTWGNFDTFSVGATVPLVASGSVNGVGNVEIVTAPNGGGRGIPVSIWSATDADVDKTGGGSAASVGTCQLGEYLRSTPESQLLTTCATVNNACGCETPANGATKEIVYAKNPDFLSGHVAGAALCCENIDILDVDGGKGASPDITFYPGNGMDDVADLTDDSLFEYVFGVSDESQSTKSPISGTGQTETGAFCGAPTGTDCAIWNLTQADRLNAQQVTCAQLNALGSSASGLYYVTTSPCSLPPQIGTPDAPALVVVNEDATLNNTLMYGLLFVRSATKGAFLRGTGNAKVFGSVVIEGATDIAGGFTVVYSNVNTSKPGDKLPETTRFGFVPGSWLDSATAGF
jgi:hypothetical protein